jgi:hypothetical protein
LVARVEEKPLVGKAEVRGEAERFARGLAEIYGDSLISVLLYGSAARADYRPGVSDLNILVILKTLDLQALRRAGRLVADWVARGNPPPLMLTKEEWLGSADVFPIEYSDIRDGYVLLMGVDPVQGVRIGRDHLRYRLEYELRSKKIQLREGFLAAGDSAEQVGALLLRSIPTFLTMFRSILRLTGTPIPEDQAELVRTVAGLVSFSADPVLEVLRRRDHPAGFVTDPDGPVPAGYLAAVERTAEWLDRFAPTPDLEAAV